MKKFVTLRFALVVLGLLTAAVWLTPFDTIAEYFNDDPDIPNFIKKAKSAFSKEEYRHMRQHQVELYRGMDDGDRVQKIMQRSEAIATMRQQEDDLRARPESPEKDALLMNWTAIGPDPIPNGQTQVVSTAVSGRVTAIAVHPANPDIVYVGTAQGGLYRSTNGGNAWTPLLDGAESLAIGAVAISPSQPETIYVGTGEPNFSADSYFGVGVYRIDNASTSATVSGPFGSANFSGRSIAEILVHPTDPATIFVASASAAAAINGGTAPPTTVPAQNRGIWRSSNATSGSPTFAQLAYPFVNQNLSCRDIVLDPQDPNFLVAWVVANGGGVIVSNNAMNADPATVTFVQRVTVSSTSTSEVNGELALTRPAGAPLPTVYVATGNLGGRVLRSIDGGVTFPQQIDNNFCTPQCFYDIAVAADPTNADRVYVGGAPTIVFAFSINGGSIFTESESGLHVDTHAITVAPSNPNIIYFGSDGGVYRSDTQGLAWVQKNGNGFLATQFMGLDNHPADPNIMIGGTQDNGTNRFTSAGTWTRTDFGDGGYSVIDQSSSSVVSFNQYHTYFNASNLTAYAFSSNPAAFENWTVRGCNGGIPNDGITCTAVINFYAPLERGPGTPNTIYYGADRLYRSDDTGDNHTTVSQTFTSPISAIGIAPTDDNVRIIGQNNGGLFGTTTGASPLVDLDPLGAVPNNFVTRTIIHPTDPNTAYVTLALFNAPQVFRTSNLSSFADEGLVAPTWTAISGTGLPQVPINAFYVHGPTGFLYAGTDIGVYISINNGNIWTPFGTGLPRIAVFDLAPAPGGILRAATHGKGIYQIPLFEPTAAPVMVSGRILSPLGTGVGNAVVSFVDESGNTRVARSNAFGYYAFEDVVVGHTYIFSVTSRRYTFAPRAVSVNEELSELDFTAE